MLAGSDVKLYIKSIQPQTIEPNGSHYSIFGQPCRFTKDVQCRFKIKPTLQWIQRRMPSANQEDISGTPTKVLARAETHRSSPRFFRRRWVRALARHASRTCVQRAIKASRHCFCCRYSRVLQDLLPAIDRTASMVLYKKSRSQH